MFHDWDGFYLLIGSSSGALIGLLFVVATLTAGFDRDQAMRGAKVYLTPTVFHFAAVLAVSAIALAPGLSAGAAALLVGAAALVGLVHATVVAVQLRTDRTLNVPHWSDFWFYGVAPAGMYLALAAAVLAAAAAPAAGPYAVGAALVALLLAAIRNAWDLVTWMAPGAARSGPAQP